MDHKKPTYVKLRDVQKDEKWLQKIISDDPSILRLGDLNLIQRERTQSTGGRIDFLMYNPDDNVHFEIEVMLGTLDESHIIRTIEYWDVESRSHTSYEHVAVIVAEEITQRFFNVIALFNRAIPIIAIQLNAMVVDNVLVLDFVKVLDIVEQGEDEESENAEETDRQYWVKKANPKSIEVMDKLIKLFDDKSPQVTYNKNHIALGTTGRNFVWFHPRKVSHIHFDIRTGTELIDEFSSKMSDAGISCHSSPNKTHLKIQLTMKEYEDNIQLIKDLLNRTELIYSK